MGAAEALPLVIAVDEGAHRPMRGRTTIVVAHRLTTVEHADQILVLDGGRIVEHGTPAQPMAAHGHQARLDTRHFEDGAEAAAVTSDKVGAPHRHCDGEAPTRGITPP